MKNTLGRICHCNRGCGFCKNDEYVSPCSSSWSHESCQHTIRLSCRFVCLALSAWCYRFLLFAATASLPSTVISSWSSKNSSSESTSIIGLIFRFTVFFADSRHSRCLMLGSSMRCCPVGSGLLQCELLSQGTLQPAVRSVSLTGQRMTRNIACFRFLLNFLRRGILLAPRGLSRHAYELEGGRLLGEQSLRFTRDIAHTLADFGVNWLFIFHTPPSLASLGCLSLL